MWLIPLLAGLISALLTMNMAQQYTCKRKRHQLFYALGLACFTIAAFTEFYAAAFGWTTLAYKVYYYTAITLVPLLACGSVFLLQYRWLSIPFTVYTLTTSFLMLIQLIPARVDMAPLLIAGLEIGGSAMPEAIRQYSFPLSGMGGMVLIGVAVFSWMRTRYRGNLYILAGALVMSIGGTLAKTSVISLLPLSELMGIGLLYLGVVHHPGSTTRKKSPTSEVSA